MIVRQCREMFDSDPRCEGLIGKPAGFTLTVENSPQAQQVADELIKRLNLTIPSLNSSR